MMPVKELKPPPPEWKEIPKFGYLYILKNPQHSHVKIGHTTAPLKRIGDLRYPVDLSASTIYRFPTADAAKGAELFLHRQLRPFHDLAYGQQNGNDKTYKLERHPGYSEWFRIDADAVAKDALQKQQRLLGWWSALSADLVAHKPVRPTPSTTPAARDTAQLVQMAAADLRRMKAKCLILRTPDAPADQGHFFAVAADTEANRAKMTAWATTQLRLRNGTLITPFSMPIPLTAGRIATAIDLMHPNHLELCRETPLLAKASLALLNLRNTPFAATTIAALSAHLGSTHNQYPSLGWPDKPPAPSAQLSLALSL